MDWDAGLLVVTAEVCLGWEATGVGCCLEAGVSGVVCPCGMDDWPCDDTGPGDGRASTNSSEFSHVCLDVMGHVEEEDLDDRSIPGGGSGCCGVPVNWALAGTSPGEFCSTEAFIDPSMKELGESSGCALPSCSKRVVDLLMHSGRATG